MGLFDLSYAHEIRTISVSFIASNDAINDNIDRYVSEYNDDLCDHLSFKT